MIYVLYHANCTDGFGAAFSAWVNYQDKATYIAVKHEEPAPSLPNAQKVYILDFSYPKDVLITLSKACEVVVLDHHKSAFENIFGRSPKVNERLSYSEKNLDIHFDMNCSGALMAYQHFFPSNDVPFLILSISDRDLWKFNLPNTKEIHAAIGAYPMDFQVWSRFLDHESNLIEEGTTLLRKQNQEIENICKNAYMTKISGYTIPIVNTSVHNSDVCDKLLSLYPNVEFSACYTDLADNVRIVSLRSKGFDVSEVAKEYGGGGHAKAAGFKLYRSNIL